MLVPFGDETVRCLTCGADLFNAAKKPRKVFRYIPIIPQLVRLFASATSAQNMTWGVEHEFDANCVRDITESPGFAEFVRESLCLDDPRHVALLASTDGVQPFSGSSHDIWPISLAVLNLPPHLRNSPRHLILCGLIPGPRAPQNVNTYLNLLVDELLTLNGAGVRARDASRGGEAFTLKAKLCLMVADYRGAAKVNCQKGAGAIGGCMKCEVGGETAAGDGKKKVYVEFRRFLPADHPFRKDAVQFGSVESRHAPEMRTHTQLKAFAVASERAIHEFKAKPGSVGDPSKVTSVTGASQLLRLPYWDHVACSPAELMHLLVRALTFCSSFRCAEVTVRQEGTAKRFIELFKGERGVSDVKDKPDGRLVMTDESRKLVQDRLESLQLPSDFGSNCSGLWNYTGTPFASFGSLCLGCRLPFNVALTATTGYMRAHDWLVLVTVLSVFAFRSSMHSPLLHVFLRFCEVMVRLTARVVSPQDLDRLQLDVVECLCLVELHLPQSELTILFHLLLHGVHYIRISGPYSA